jgi:hypothetical protein
MYTRATARCPGLPKNADWSENSEVRVVVRPVGHTASKIASVTGVYFLESGLFNGLRSIQIKKLSSLSASRGGCDELGFQTAYGFPRPAAAGRIDSANRNKNEAYF